MVRQRHLQRRDQFVEQGRHRGAGVAEVVFNATEPVGEVDPRRTRKLLGGLPEG